MSYSQLILKDYADITWPLDDINTASALSRPINFFYPDSKLYSASVNFNAVSVQNVPMIFGGKNLLQFTSSAVGLSIPALGRFSNMYKDKNSVITFWLKVDKIGTEEQPIFKKRGEENVGLFIKDNYLIFKFGNSSSFSRVVTSIADMNEPHYIVVGAGPGYRSLMVDGLQQTVAPRPEVYPETTENIFENDVIDFYGPSTGLWQIDSPTFFPNMINSSTAKRHYVYGLGQWIDDGIFFNRGGVLYNFTTIETNPISRITWDYPEEWQLSEFEDLQSDQNGIRPLAFSQPQLYSYDNNINKSNDSIKFSSASQTLTSYIDLLDINQIILDGSYPFFVKFKLNGQLPDNQLSQRLVSYGNIPDVDMVSIELINDNNQYKILFIPNNSSFTASFNIQNITASPDIYVGMKFDESSTLYFCEEGQSIQSFSFSYLNEDGFGLDPLEQYFPPESNTSIRIGGALTYDLKNTRPLQPRDFKQFYGTFEKFIVIKPQNFSNINNFNDLEEIKKVRYGAKYLSAEDRFIVSTYGYGSFNIHSSDIAEIIDDDTHLIGANVIDVGYPDIESASNVVFNVTQYSYSGSAISQTQRLDKKTYLGFLNNVNVASSYLKFNFEIFSEDTLLIPPTIKYFYMETFKSKDNSVIIKDDAGPSYRIHPNTSSIVFLPENRLTPNVFLRDNSGLRLNNNIVDFTDNFYPVPLDPRDIPGLVVWLDARYPLGLRKSRYLDDQKVYQWYDLSTNDFHATQSSSVSQPIYRYQSLNMFSTSQFSAENTNNVFGVSASVSTSILNATSGGIKSFEVRPIGNSINSYMNIGNNTASMTVFPNQSYTAVGTITLSKRQTASALHQYARSIVVQDLSTASISSISVQPENSAGTYSLSAIFTTSSATNAVSIRYYNGSYNLDDPVYWSKLGLYNNTSSVSYGSIGSASIAMPISTWLFPLTEANDHPVLKFNGKNTFMTTTASVSSPYVIYMVSKHYNSGALLSSPSAVSILYSNSASYFTNSASLVPLASKSDSYDILALQVHQGVARLFVNGKPQKSVQSLQNTINKIDIGRGKILSSMNYLSGDISALLVYSGEHDYQTRSAIENWLDESFNLLQPVIGVKQLNDRYTDNYEDGYSAFPEP